MDDSKQKTKFSFSPKNFFLHAGSLISLYASIILLLMLIYAIINLTVGESFYESDNSTIRFAVSGLIVVLPLHIIISIFLGKMYREIKEFAVSHTKKWSGYLTLFLAGVTLAVDLMTVIYRLLEGDTTLAFLLKAIAVFVVVGSVFAYYVKDINKEDYSDKKCSKIFAITAGVLALVFIVTGFMFAGSPNEVRKEKRDQERVYDLQNIQQSVVTYWQEKGTLPENLDQTINPLSGRSIPVDPNGNDYVYKKIGDQTFELCATFETEDHEGEKSITRYPYMETNSFFEHGIGEICFEREVDEDVYPIKSNREVLDF